VKALGDRQACCQERSEELIPALHPCPVAEQNPSDWCWLDGDRAAPLRDVP